MCVEFHRSEYLEIASHFETMDSWKVWSNCIAQMEPHTFNPGTWGDSQGDLYALETSFICVVRFRPVITPQWDPVSRKINVKWGGRISLSPSIGESTQEDPIMWYLRTWGFSPVAPGNQRPFCVGRSWWECRRQTCMDVGEIILKVLPIAS